METDNRFILDPRRGSNCKTTCPNCGQKKCFKRYIDTESGEALDNSCGRCDHEQSCGYHYKPHDLFHDRPELKDKLFPKEASTYRQPAQRAPSMPKTMPHPLIAPVVTLPDEYVKARHTPDEHLYPWLCRMLGEEKARKAFDDYQLGAIRSGTAYGGQIIFWYIDANGIVHDGKVMLYGDDGHRKGNPNWISALLRQAGKLPANSTTEKCLFGEHLLPLRPDAKVAIVESEKSAIYLSCVMPEFIWLATGGCSMLTAEKIEALRDRHITLYPDSGMLDKWKEKLRDLKEINYRLSDKLEAYPPNTDLVDLLTGEVRPIEVQPTPEPTPPPAPIVTPPNPAELAYAEMCKTNPDLEVLRAAFDLVPEEVIPF